MSKYVTERLNSTVRNFNGRRIKGWEGQGRQVIEEIDLRKGASEGLRTL